MRHTKHFTNLWTNDEFDNILCSKDGQSIVADIIALMIICNPSMTHMSSVDWLSYILGEYEAIVYFNDKSISDITFIPKP